MREKMCNMEYILNRLPGDVKMHCCRVGVYARMFAHRTPELWDYLPCNRSELVINAIFDGGVYHDIGKSMFSHMLLNAPRALSETERDVMKVHPIRAKEIVEADNITVQKGELYKTIVIDCCLYHHERYDGHGYPYGHHGKQIPLHSQIVTVCDILDALTSHRPYNKTLSFEEATTFIIEQRNEWFSKAILHRFAECHEDMYQLYKEPRRQSEELRKKVVISEANEVLNDYGIRHITYNGNNCPSGILCETQEFRGDDPK